MRVSLVDVLEAVRAEFARGHHPRALVRLGDGWIECWTLTVAPERAAGLRRHLGSRCRWPAAGMPEVPGYTPIALIHGDLLILARQP